VITHREKAIILTLNTFDKLDAKTAHGLIRGTQRFEILAVVDSKNYGVDAGEKLDGIPRNIPILASVHEAVHSFPDASVAIIGIATHGGVIPIDLEIILIECLKNGLSLVNGLHEFLSEKPHFVDLATQHNAYLKDVRKPKSRKDLSFWTGRVNQVSCPVIAVIGTDCAVGKRTTARLLTEALKNNGKKAEMIYTGQTGWLQGGKYGFIFDSTLNDFVSGELEDAIFNCFKNENPDFILLEGQSALRNPSGPCGSEFFVSGKAKYAILVHAPKRFYYDDDPTWGEIHSLASEIMLIKAYGATVIGIALNTQDCTSEEAVFFKNQYFAQFNIPVILPLEEGFDRFLPVLFNL
jgi:uncharacterized NAD-dependent epimerase/dehydratase family protein